MLTINDMLSRSLTGEFPELVTAESVELVVDEGACSPGELTVQPESVSHSNAIYLVTIDNSDSNAQALAVEVCNLLTRGEDTIESAFTGWNIAAGEVKGVLVAGILAGLPALIRLTPASVPDDTYSVYVEVRRI